MLPTVSLVAIEIAGLIALWSAASDIRTRKADGGQRLVIARADNRAGFYLVVAGKLGAAGFAAAMLLHAIGLIGDPVAALQQALPFFARRPPVSP